MALQFDRHQKCRLNSLPVPERERRALVMNRRTKEKFITPAFHILDLVQPLCSQAEGLGTAQVRNLGEPILSISLQAWPMLVMSN